MSDQGDFFGEPIMPSGKGWKAICRLAVRPGLARAVACVKVAMTLARCRVRGATAKNSAIVEGYFVAALEEPFNHEDRIALLCLAGLRPAPEGAEIPPNWFPDPEEVRIEEEQIWQRAERVNQTLALVIRQHRAQQSGGGGHD
jgi:hypothetical protein